MYTRKNVNTQTSREFLCTISYGEKILFAPFRVSSFPVINQFTCFFRNNQIQFSCTVSNHERRRTQTNSNSASNYTETWGCTFLSCRVHRHRCQLVTKSGFHRFTRCVYVINFGWRFSSHGDRYLISVSICVFYIKFLVSAIDICYSIRFTTR